MYSRKVDNKVLTFGVSGRLYKSNVLLYDRQTESLWSQLKQTAVTGPLAGTRLAHVASSQRPWSQWRRQHPATTVLSDDTGYNRDYGRDPYEGYARVGTIWFPVGDVRRDMGPKERVMGIAIGETAKAYPLNRMGAHRGSTFSDTVSDTAITIAVNAAGQITAVTDAAGKALPHTFAFWFAWQAFHPKTAVYSPN